MGAVGNLHVLRVVMEHGILTGGGEDMRQLLIGRSLARFGFNRLLSRACDSINQQGILLGQNRSQVQ